MHYILHIVSNIWNYISPELWRPFEWLLLMAISKNPWHGGWCATVCEKMTGSAVEIYCCKLYCWMFRCICKFPVIGLSSLILYYELFLSFRRILKKFCGQTDFQWTVLLTLKAIKAQLVTLQHYLWERQLFWILLHYQIWWPLCSLLLAGWCVRVVITFIHCIKTK